MDIEHYELANQIELIGIEMRNSLRQVAFSEMSASATQIQQCNFLVTFRNNHLIIRDITNDAYITIDITGRDINNVSSIIFSDYISILKGISSSLLVSDENIAASMKVLHEVNKKIDDITIDYDDILKRLTNSETNITSLNKLFTDVNAAVLILHRICLSSHSSDG
jgi:hypothetical protein